jgi:hypothetical protein
MPQLWGKYRGVVLDNADPEGRGRLRLAVPSMDGLAPRWAEACLTPSEARSSESFVPPPIGAEVWLEFERGDADFPVWTGCPWPRN